jgi:DNA-binding HxlR family transcriptional regulator
LTQLTSIGRVLHRTYDGQACSVARALEVVGERWSILILRDAFLGVRRFDGFQEDLGIARNVLADRLGRLVDAGVLEKHAYSDRPPRYEYRLTDKGRDLWPVVHALAQWGDHHEAPDGPPTLFVHRGCGGAVSDRRTCDSCGAPLDARDVEAVAGPGAAEHPGALLGARSA